MAALQFSVLFFNGRRDTAATAVVIPQYYCCM